MNIVIKPILIKEHMELMDRMLKELHISEKAFFAQTADWESISVQYMRHMTEMQEDYDGTCLIAYADEVAAGFIFAYTEEPDDSRIESYTGNTLYVSDGFVQQAFRRQGIYRQLNDQLERIYHNKGVRRIVRYTLTNNQRMQQFLSTQRYTAVRLVYEKWLDKDGNAIEIGLQPKN